MDMLILNKINMVMVMVMHMKLKLKVGTGIYTMSMGMLTRHLVKITDMLTPTMTISN